MGYLNFFVFALLAVLSILPSGLALPRARRCPTNHTTNGDPPSYYSLPPTRTNVVGPSLSPSPILPQSTSTPIPLPTTSSNPGSGSAPPSSDIQTFLDTHNTFRAKHGASPLAWSDSLASKAQEWAGRCQFEHSGGQLGNFGENLAAGTGEAYGISSAVKAWTDESSDYDPANPVYSHFTQVVWKSTTQLGCFLKICDNNNIFDAARFGPTKFVVCEYYPPGNVIGQFGENVQA